jgi:sugar lactone lactonase YvrE
MLLRVSAAAVLVVALGAAIASGARAHPGHGHSGREFLDVRVFTRIGEPGQPEPVAIGPPQRRVYIGSNQLGHGDADAPSVVWAYSRSGRLLRTYELKGQATEEDHGIQGLAFDGSGRLYALDRSVDPRVVRLNPRTGRQSEFGTFADVPPCEPSMNGEPAWSRGDQCSATTMDEPAAPDYAAFGPDGRLYVSDIEQALIWRLPRRGGEARVWFSDPLFENIFGPNGLQFVDDGRTLLMALTARSPRGGNPTVGGLYEIGVAAPRRKARPRGLETFWESRPLDGPDGFAVGRSGRIYLALAGASQLVVLSSQGEELQRVPEEPMGTSDGVRWDGPGSVAFLGRRVLVTNHSPIMGNPDSWAVFDVWTGERGLPLYRPALRSRPR